MDQTVQLHKFQMCFNLKAAVDRLLTPEDTPEYFNLGLALKLDGQKKKSRVAFMPVLQVGL